MSTIPATIEQRPLGRTGQMVSILGVGGSHLARAGHARGVAGDERFAFGIAGFVERLKPEHRDAFEALIDDARRERADDFAQQHQAISVVGRARPLGAPLWLFARTARRSVPTG